MYFLFNSSNPETIELFRSTYYKPKLGICFLLFILFPSIDRSQTQHQYIHKEASPSLSTTPATTTTVETTTCPDGYRDHRNNLICPHAPKRLKSVRLRLSQVLLDFKISFHRLILSQDYHQHQHAKRLEQQHRKEQQQQQQLKHHYHHNQASFSSLILCAPITNPYVHLMVILHILYMIQGVSLLVEDALIKDACFSARIHSRFRRSKSWSKSWSRFKFRFFHQYSQPGFLHPFLIWLLCVFAILVISSESFHSSHSSNASTWLDLPFRSKCNPTLDFHQEYTDPNINKNSPLTILNLLEFIFKKNSSRFLTLFNKPTKSIILIECFISCLCLLQPIQHILPSKIVPKLVRIPDWFLDIRLKKIGNNPTRTRRRRRNEDDDDDDIDHHHHASFFDDYPGHLHRSLKNQHSAPPIVQVETKWLLALVVELSIGISSIIGYLILITHIPYKSHYSIPFFLSIYWIKSFYKSIYKLITSSVNTIDCLRLVIHEFSGKSNPKQGRIKRVVSEGEDEDEDDEWTCSICFEESSDDSEDSNSTPPSPSLPPTNSSSSPPLPSTTSSPLLENDLLTSSLSTHKTSTLTKKKELRDQSNRSTLSCGHSYHTNCLVKWLHYQPFCPICHRSVL
ncbi:hypothetical protein Pst134EA_019290 [Puccinia striiformis f. sp. tritici]|uniref:hypothetical protein n=1 Tax=Puccinia striiformis f. sp. tritici TaxID=168172 RepID=UPI0020079644|nr:hypothetical protein Pst134EA_019290 [Puccinia striiformis f. sp. tritici]KAH9459135.1 hypothetical protein Pst134EA_019290 [Puccinia striiformis f. sp. tritici]